MGQTVHNSAVPMGQADSVNGKRVAPSDLVAVEDDDNGRIDKRPPVTHKLSSSLSREDKDFETFQEDYAPHSR